MKMLVALFVITCVLVGNRVVGADTGDHDTPSILVELFTSEGCSSCPPADAALQKMDVSQPIPGARVIVLSEHVDYWDHDGWKDPYSMHLLTDRQSAYAHALGLGDVYTPQFIVDGRSELRGDSQRASQVFQEAAAGAKIPVHINWVKFEGAAPAIVHAQIEIEGASAKHNADVYAALALDHAESQVLRGENSGRRLAYVAVVQNLTKIGRVEKGKNFEEEITLKLGPGTDPANVRVIAFAQESGPGRVLGVAMQKNNN
jgi:hypothetical protein